MARRLPAAVVVVAMVSAVRVYWAIARDLALGDGRIRRGFAFNDVFAVVLRLPLGVLVLYTPRALGSVLGVPVTLSGAGTAAAYGLCTASALGLFAAITRG